MEEILRELPCRLTRKLFFSASRRRRKQDSKPMRVAARLLDILTVGCGAAHRIVQSEKLTRPLASTGIRSRVRLGVR